MKNPTVSLLALLFFFCFFSCTPSGPAPTGHEEKIQKVESGLSTVTLIEGDPTWTIEARMAHYGVTGVSLAVIHDYEIAWVKTYGIMDSTTQEPVTPQTLFQAGSISKPVAAYGALRLVQEGKLSLDEDINTYLTSWQLPANELTQAKPVALKHLLNHSAGLTVHGFLGYRPGLDVPTLTQVLDGAAPANSPPIRVDLAPETQYRYSGGGYCVMQQILIDVEGQPFPQILKEKVLDPLGMDHSTYEQPLPPEKLPLAATGYLPDRTEVEGKRHTYPEMAAAGLWTTAEDLAHFAVDLQLSVQGRSNHVLSQEMAEKMLTPFVSDFCGLGIFLQQYGEDTYFGHGGWDEGFSSELIAHQKDGYGVVILTNANQPAFITELIRSVARAYDWEGYVDPAFQPQPIDAEILQEITGRYQLHADRIVEILAREGRPYLVSLEEGDTSELVQVDSQTFLRRESRNRYQFLPHPETGDLHLVILEAADAAQEFNHPRLGADQKVPLEWVLAGDYDRALAAYTSLRQDPESKDLAAEDRLNGLGYALMSEGMLDEAIILFRINVALHPEGFNTYDSLGEAYLEKGETALSMANYLRSLELNPDNRHAAEVLEKMAGE